MQAKDDKWGYIDENQNEVIPCIYFSAANFQKGFAIVATGENKYGIIDKNGREVLPCEYTSIERVTTEELAIVAFDAKYGVFDMSGKELAPCEYDSITFDWKNHVLNASINEELYTIGSGGSVKVRDFKSGQLRIDEINIPLNTFSLLDTKTGEKLNYSMIVINRAKNPGDLFSPYEKKNVEKILCVMSDGTETVRFVTNKAVSVQEMDYTAFTGMATLRYELNDGKLTIYWD